MAKRRIGSGTKKRGGKPPRSGQYKPGQSGNKKGRPRGRKNFSTLVREAAGQTFEATINGKKRRITATQSALLQLAGAAAKGDHRSIILLLNYVDEIERRAEAARPQEFPFSQADQEIIKNIYTRMQECKAPTDKRS